MDWKTVEAIVNAQPAFHSDRGEATLHACRESNHHCARRDEQHNATREVLQTHVSQPTAALDSPKSGRANQNQPEIAENERAEKRVR